MILFISNSFNFVSWKFPFPFFSAVLHVSIISLCAFCFLLRQLCAFL